MRIDLKFMNSKGWIKMNNKINNDLKLSAKEKLMFLFLFIMYVIVSSLDFQMLTLEMNLN